MKDKCYISGPMTGLPNNNFDAFNHLAKLLEEIGYEYENPAEKGIIEGWTWNDYMRYDIEKMMSCNVLAQLPGWENSRGAQLEFAIAKGLGFRIVNLDYLTRFAPASRVTVS